VAARETSDLWRERAGDLNICFVFVYGIFFLFLSPRGTRKRTREKLTKKKLLGKEKGGKNRGCRKDDKKWVDLSKKKRKEKKKSSGNDKVRLVLC
jgi:hypothetical protein